MSARLVKDVPRSWRLDTCVRCLRTVDGRKWWSSVVVTLVMFLKVRSDAKIMIGNMSVDSAGARRDAMCG